MLVLVDEEVEVLVLVEVLVDVLVEVLVDVLVEVLVDVLVEVLVDVEVVGVIFAHAQPANRTLRLHVLPFCLLHCKPRSTLNEDLPL